MHCCGPVCSKRDSLSPSIGGMQAVCICGCEGCASARERGKRRHKPFPGLPADPAFDAMDLPSGVQDIARRRAPLLDPAAGAMVVVQTVTLGFSSDYAMPIEPGATVEIKRPVQGISFRPLRLEIRPRSALAFDVIAGQIGCRTLLLDAEVICLAVFPPAAKVRFAPRVWTLPYGETLKLGESVKMTLRNVSDKPSRFCANLIGVGVIPGLSAEGLS